MISFFNEIFEKNKHEEVENSYYDEVERKKNYYKEYERKNTKANLQNQQPKKQNIFNNNQLYYQKFRELENKMANLTKVNHFLINQVIQSSNKGFQSNKKLNTKPIKSIKDVANTLEGINKNFEEGKLQYEKLNVNKNDLCNLQDVLKIMTCDIDNQKLVFDEYINQKLINLTSDQFVDSFEKGSKSQYQNLQQLFLIIIRLMQIIYQGSDNSDQSRTDGNNSENKMMDEACKKMKKEDVFTSLKNQYEFPNNRAKKTYHDAQMNLDDYFSKYSNETPKQAGYYFSDKKIVQYIGEIKSLANQEVKLESNSSSIKSSIYLEPSQMKKNLEIGENELKVTRNSEIMSSIVYREEYGQTKSFENYNDNQISSSFNDLRKKQLLQMGENYKEELIKTEKTAVLAEKWTQTSVDDSGGLDGNSFVVLNNESYINE